MLSAVACGGLDNKLTVFPLALEDDSQSKKKVQRWCFWIYADEFDDHRDFDDDAGDHKLSIGDDHDYPDGVLCDGWPWCSRWLSMITMCIYERGWR